MNISAHTSEFREAATNSLADGSFVKLTLGGYQGDEDGLKAIHIRKILVKREEKLSFTYRYKTRDIVKNYAPDEALAMIGDFIAEDFRTATLFTTGFDLALDGKTMKKNPPSQSEAPSLDHDRSKNRLIEPAGKSWLHDLGITDKTGKIHNSAQDKFRQINRYVEILSGLIEGKKLNRVVDMGSGKGYLTFALYDYMTAAGFAPHITGVEYRADMVALCNKIAQKAGFAGLDFAQGTIDSFDSAGTDLLIALHACDTATDDALAKGIEAGAELIVVAPCCHKQVRRQMEETKKHNDLDFLTRHGIFTERQAEMVTDGIRALILEYCGYSVKVFEFISDTHTPKNVMIVGTKNPKAKKKDPAVLKKIEEAKAYFGIARHHLESVMERI